jgi:peptidoglycan/xylan/chitin deacetylase (PgdA/CDA1 family)
VQTAEAPDSTTTSEAAPAESQQVATPERPPVQAEHPSRSGRLRRPGNYQGELARAGAGGTKVALTFDAGASAAPTPAILRALKAAGVHVTFFLTGKWCEQNPELVKEIVAEGHQIGNHTYSHQDLRKLSDEQIVDQLRRMDNIVRDLTGQDTKPYFRPPYGARDKRVLRVAADEGYVSVFWSVDSWDAFKKGITTEEIESRVLGRVHGGDIVLLHCGSKPTADAVPYLIRELQSRGYQIVRVSELVGDSR